MEKFLEGSGIKLSSVVSDLTGVSSRAMLEALISGERNPEVPASPKAPCAPKSPSSSTRSPAGSRANHAFMARLHLEQNNARTRSIDALTGRIEEAMTPFRTAAYQSRRPELGKALASANRAGDQVVITRRDRLGRSVLYLRHSRRSPPGPWCGRACPRARHRHHDRGRAGDFLAELQRELIIANTRGGLVAARARGRTGGRRPKLIPDQPHHAHQLYDAGDHTVQRIAALL